MFGKVRVLLSTLAKYSLSVKFGTGGPTSPEDKKPTAALPVELVQAPRLQVRERKKALG